MFCKVYCACCNGIDAITVTVEVDITPGISFNLVGLPDVAVKESLQRISGALGHFGFKIPGKRILVNMAPANIKKEGSAFDLAIAVGILYASGQIIKKGDGTELYIERKLSGHLIMGELALDGTLRDFQGALAIAASANKMGFRSCIFPRRTAMECTEIDNVSIFWAESVEDVINILESPDRAQKHLCSKIPYKSPHEQDTLYENDFAYIRGQEIAKKGLEVAAAGGHNILLSGSPGCGKTLLARSLSSILPSMTKEEAIDTSKIYSVAGLLKECGGLLKERPFRAPHHTASTASLTGGGSNALPGEISLAHNGVLFLDEFTEFPRHTIEVLRQPMEDGFVQISRVRKKVIYPCSFTLVAAMNPCPCGYYNTPGGKCTCSSSAIRKYQSKISGPILDRIDIQINLKPVPAKKIKEGDLSERSADIAKRVEHARMIQNERYRGEKFTTNSRLPANLIGKYCRLAYTEEKLLKSIMEKQQLSMRSYTRIIKIARTMADLSGSERIRSEHIAGALCFRNEI